MIGKRHKNTYIATSKLNNTIMKHYDMVKLLKKSVLALLFFIPILFSAQKAEATHMMGADITYQAIDSLKFKVTLKWYRDCQGIALNNAGQIDRKSVV